MLKTHGFTKRNVTIAVMAVLLIFGLLFVLKNFSIFKADVGVTNFKTISWTGDNVKDLKLSNISYDNMAKVFKLTPSPVIVIGHGQETGTKKFSPTDLAIDSSNKIYVADIENNRIQIFKFKKRKESA